MQKKKDVVCPCLPSKEGGTEQLVCFVTEGSLLRSNIFTEGEIFTKFAPTVQF